MDAPEPLDAEFSRAAFLTSFCFALVSSGSLLCVRLAEGHPAFSWLCSLAVTAGALLVVVAAKTSGVRTAVRVRRAPLVWRAHLWGAALAIALVHLAILIAPAGGHLTERPAQVVNDAVLIVATLGLVWSFVFRPQLVRSVLPLLSFGVLGGYAASMGSWHVDPFPGLQVQHFVVRQVFSTSAALLVFFFASGA